MKRILYFTGYRMVAQEWNGHKLNSSVYFEPDEQGLDLFNAYLSSLKQEPVRLLLDLIEEEFRQITIPLLRGADRQGIINRNFAKFFRNSDYRYALSQGVLKKGRKEEKLLLMGLTNQDLIKPWLDIIDSTRTPLSGILSLPMVSEDLVPGFKATQDCVILVSQQVPSNLRQSVFLKGKLILSRLVPIASFYQGDYASDVIRDVEGTQRYLVSQRIIDRNDVISVQILCNERHLEKLTKKCEEDSFFDFNIQDINKFIKKEKMEVIEDQDFSSVLYCYQASKKPFANHYARNKEKKYFYHYLTSLTAKVAGVALLAISAGLLSISIGKGLLYETSTNDLMLLEQKYRAKFNQLNEQKIDSDISTSNMKNVVRTVDNLKKIYLRSPQEMMAMVSQDIALFNEMRVNTLSWLVAGSADATVADAQAVKAKKNVRRGRRNTARPAQKLYEIVNVSGELLNFDGDYRYALSLINDIEDTMKVSNKYDVVQITKRPLNIESDESLSGNVNVKVNTRGDKDKKAEFSFRVVREVNLNVK